MSTEEGENLHVQWAIAEGEIAQVRMERDTLARGVLKLECRLKQARQTNQYLERVEGKLARMEKFIQHRGWCDVKRCRTCHAALDGE